MIQGNTRNHRAQIPISLTYGCDKDNNTYTYRMIGGSKVFQRVQLGPGWQNQPFTPNCEIMKGDGEMARRTGVHPAWLDWDKLMPQVIEMKAAGMNNKTIAEKLGIKSNTLDIHLQKLRKNECRQAQTPEERKAALITKLKEQTSPEQGDGKSWNLDPDPDSVKTCPECEKLFRHAGILMPDGRAVCYTCGNKPFIEKEAQPPEPEQTMTEECKGCINFSKPSSYTCKYCCKNHPEYEAQTPPEPPATNQAAQDDSGSAQNSIANTNDGWIDDMLRAQQEVNKKMAEIKPVTLECSCFNPETPMEPQRKTYTAAQYEADMKAGTYPLTEEMLDNIADDHRSALSLYCERQAEAAMIQGWVIDIFKHHQLSRGRKLELIGMLLDWEAGA